MKCNVFKYLFYFFLYCLYSLCLSLNSFIYFEDICSWEVVGYVIFFVHTFGLSIAFIEDWSLYWCVLLGYLELWEWTCPENKNLLNESSDLAKTIFVLLSCPQPSHRAWAGREYPETQSWPCPSLNVVHWRSDPTYHWLEHSGERPYTMPGQHVIANPGGRSMDELAPRAWGWKSWTFDLSAMRYHAWRGNALPPIPLGTCSSQESWLRNYEKVSSILAPHQLRHCGDQALPLTWATHQRWIWWSGFRISGPKGIYELFF